MLRSQRRRGAAFAKELSVRTVILCIVGFCACFAIVTRQLYRGYALSAPEAEGTLQQPTLVVYSYRNIEPEGISNLQFFLKNVLTPNDDARYIIVVDHGLDKYGEFHSSVLPELPPNAQYISVRSCYELGHVGMVLSGLTKAQIDLQQYTYFVWLDSSTRGPFLPSYVTSQPQAPVWHTLLTSRLSSTVKLVGATVSCAPVSLKEDTAMSVIPHVESSLMATDIAGLTLLQRAGCFRCHETWRKAKVLGEVAASAAILQAGYGLDCLMLRYQGVDWQDKTKWQCGNMISPHQEGTYDGTSLNPLEVMFVKVKHGPTMIPGTTAHQATKYTQWQSESKQPGSLDITTNVWKTHAYKAMEETIKSRDPKCFDADYYISNAPWEFEGMSSQRAYQHFVQFGFQEGRDYHFTC